MLTSKPQKIAKVVICGMKSVGKTTILEQLIYGNVTPDSVSIFDQFYTVSSFLCERHRIEWKFIHCVLLKEYHATIEDTYVASVDTGRGARDILRIYDTAGLQGSIEVPHIVIILIDRRQLKFKYILHEHLP